MTQPNNDRPMSTEQQGPPSTLEDRVQALEAQVMELQTSHQQADLLFSAAPVPYLLLDARGWIHDLNSAACVLLGRSREALLGKRLAQFLSSDSQTSCDVLLKRGLSDGLRQRGEAQVLCEDGQSFDVVLDVEVHTVDGVFKHFRLIATDITTHKQVHRDLLDTASSQEQQIETQAARVRALNQELDRVVTAFMQQLHRPLARAVNFLGLLQRNLGEQPEAVTQPLQNAEQAVRDVTTLLGHMERHMQVRKMRVRVRPVALDRVLQEVLKTAQPRIAERSVRFTHDTLPTVQGDSQVLHLILEEYVGNALKFTSGREQVRIHVRVKETESEYRIGVEDNGAGFNMRHKDNLFQLFKRLHSSKGYAGVGIGLSTVRQTCERFGARVWAEGKPDQGATFWFAWPKTPSLCG